MYTYALVQKACSLATVLMLFKIYIVHLRLLWILADKQTKSCHERMGQLPVQEARIGCESFLLGAGPCLQFEQILRWSGRCIWTCHPYICRCTVLPKHVQGPVVQVKVRVEVVWVCPVMTGVVPRHQDMTVLHVVPGVYPPPHTRGLPRMLIFGVDCLRGRLLRVQHQIQGGEDP